MLRRLLGTAALLVGAVVPLSLAPAPAHAAAGCGSQGVAVVIDFGALGGGVQQSCANGAAKAATLFAATGHTLDRVQSQPSAVCSVDHEPVDPCPQMPPATRYWGLFWTNGGSSHWTYASLGVDALNVPAGGSVAFAWQSSAGTRTPGVAPAVTKASAPSTSPKPAKSSSKSSKSAKPTAKASPSKAPAGASTQTSDSAPSASSSVRPSTAGSPAKAAKVAATPSAGATPEAGVTASATGTPASPSTAASPSDTTSSDTAAVSTTSTNVSADSNGLPGWVAPAVVVVVLAAGGGVAVVRRRARG